MYLSLSKYRNPSPGAPTRRAEMFERARKAYFAGLNPWEWKDRENFDLMDEKAQREMKAMIAYLWGQT